MLMASPTPITSTCSEESQSGQYTKLMSVRRGDPIEETLARMLSSWFMGLGGMPNFLGLSENDFQSMMEFHFPSYKIDNIYNPRKNIDSKRLDETEDLHILLMKNRSLDTPSNRWMVDIVAAGCMGSDHLWQDLGLWNRNDLSKLMLDNFNSLAVRNDKNMKWKKFLYKQLCETEGIYTCRAPSCEVCKDYHNCFGSED
jgi:nitrogen fixation protein NifQ